MKYKIIEIQNAVLFTSRLEFDMANQYFIGDTSSADKAMKF